MENWASKNHRYRDYEDNDMSDAIGELLKTNKAKRFRKIVWVELVVIIVLLALTILLIP